MPENAKDHSLVTLVRNAIECYKNEGEHAVKKICSQFERVANLSQSQELVLEKTVQIVCEHYSITEQSIFSKSRCTPLPEARRMCYVLMKFTVNISESKIAKYFNGRDAASIFRAIKEFENLKDQIKSDRVFFATYSTLEKIITEFKNTKK